MVRAISEAERALKSFSEVNSLGDIVHNRIEVQRLKELGLRTIKHADIEHSTERPLLIRAHGEPPSTYALAESLEVEVIDATCPVVAKLQRQVKSAYEQMEGCAGQVVLLGKRGHAEVVGLTGQVNDRVIVVECEADLEAIDFARPIYFLSQTTQSIALFEELATIMRERTRSEIIVRDTICRQVSSREEHLRGFVQQFDVIIFVCGRKSSNGRVLYEMCREANPHSYNIESEDELQHEWFGDGVESVGICGATSTPGWLMEQVAAAIQLI